MTAAGHNQDGDTGGPSAGDAQPGKGRELSREEQLDVIKANVCTLIDRQAPVLIEAVQNTAGIESGKLTIGVEYKPGGGNQRARIQVKGGLSIPGGGFFHECAIKETEDGGAQLVLFEEQAN